MRKVISLFPECYIIISITLWWTQSELEKKVKKCWFLSPVQLFVTPLIVAYVGYGFPSGDVWMWELDCEESWVLKNWCFWTVVLEKTLERTLNCKDIQPVHPKGDLSWVFIG